MKVKKNSFIFTRSFIMALLTLATTVYSGGPDTELIDSDHLPLPSLGAQQDFIRGMQELCFLQATQAGNPQIIYEKLQKLRNLSERDFANVSALEIINGNFSRLYVMDCLLSSSNIYPQQICSKILASDREATREICTLLRQLVDFYSEEAMESLQTLLIMIGFAKSDAFFLYEEFRNQSSDAGIPIRLGYQDPDILEPYLRMYEGCILPSCVLEAADIRLVNRRNEDYETLIRDAIAKIPPEALLINFAEYISEMKLDHLTPTLEMMMDCFLMSPDAKKILTQIDFRGLRFPRKAALLEFLKSTYECPKEFEQKKLRYACDALFGKHRIQNQDTIFQNLGLALTLPECVAGVTFMIPLMAECSYPENVARRTVGRQTAKYIQSITDQFSPSDLEDLRRGAVLLEEVKRQDLQDASSKVQELINLAPKLGLSRFQVIVNANSYLHQIQNLGLTESDLKDMSKILAKEASYSGRTCDTIFWIITKQPELVDKMLDMILPNRARLFLHSAEKDLKKCKTFPDPAVIHAFMEKLKDKLNNHM